MVVSCVLTYVLEGPGYILFLVVDFVTFGRFGNLGHLYYDPGRYRHTVIIHTCATSHKIIQAKQYS